MKLLIVDSRISPACERGLLKEGFTLLKLPPDRDLGEAICSHPDSVLFYLNNEIVTTADYCDCASYVFSDLREMCPEVKIHFTSDVRRPVYPYDCIFNAWVIGKYIFCKSDSISSKIKEMADRLGYEICHTNQGYPACTVLSFGNNAITTDRGIAKVLEQKGIDVTLIGNAGISLPPHEYGFIGGASGVVGKRVYFFGNILSHPDGRLICNRILEAGYTPVSLSDEPLCDLGGIIAL